MGLDDLGRSWAHAFALYAPVATIIDADGLTHLAERRPLSVEGRCGAADPHAASRRGGAPTWLGRPPTFKPTASTAAEALAKMSGQVVILKGARSVVAGREDDLRVCAEGTPALGVAGTGDVLSGVVGALALTLCTDRCRDCWSALARACRGAEACRRRSRSHRLRGCGRRTGRVGAPAGPLSRTTRRQVDTTPCHWGDKLTLERRRSTRIAWVFQMASPLQ